jgi:hypothetical protein
VLDAYIIDYLRRKQQEESRRRQHDQPVVELPIPLAPDEHRPTPDGGRRRGILIIPVNDDPDEEAA